MLMYFFKLNLLYSDVQSGKEISLVVKPKSFFILLSSPISTNPNFLFLLTIFPFLFYIIFLLWHNFYMDVTSLEIHTYFNVHFVSSVRDSLQVFKSALCMLKRLTVLKFILLDAKETWGKSHLASAPSRSESIFPLNALYLIMHLSLFSSSAIARYHLISPHHPYLCKLSRCFIHYEFASGCPRIN